MSTIDTVESVRRAAEDWETFGAIDARDMLARYAALLEAVNRPVTDEQVEFACRTICKDKGHDPDERLRYNGGKLVRDKQGNFYPYWTTYEVDAKTSLEAHMAALREEVGK